MRRDVLAFPMTALAFVAGVSAAQDAEVHGATIVLVPKTVTVQTVTIEVSHAGAAVPAVAREIAAAGICICVVASIEKEAARQADVLTRTLAAPQSLQSADTVSIAPRPSTKTRYVVAISNLRDSPIEAIAFDHYPLRSDRPRGGESGSRNYSPSSALRARPLSTA
jgi:hypothetical protein